MSAKGDQGAHCRDSVRPRTGLNVHLFTGCLSRKARGPNPLSQRTNPDPYPRNLPAGHPKAISYERKHVFYRSPGGSLPDPFPKRVITCISAPQTLRRRHAEIAAGSRFTRTALPQRPVSGKSLIHGAHRLNAREFSQWKATSCQHNTVYSAMLFTSVFTAAIDRCMIVGEGPVMARMEDSLPAQQEFRRVGSLCRSEKDPGLCGFCFWYYPLSSYLMLCFRRSPAFTALSASGTSSPS